MVDHNLTLCGYAAKEALARDKDLLVAKELRVIALREQGGLGAFPLPEK